MHYGPLGSHPSSNKAFSFISVIFSGMQSQSHFLLSLTLTFLVQKTSVTIHKTWRFDLSKSFGFNKYSISTTLVTEIFTDIHIRARWQRNFPRANLLGSQYPRPAQSLLWWQSGLGSLHIINTHVLGPSPFCGYDWAVIFPLAEEKSIKSLPKKKSKPIKYNTLLYYFLFLFYQMIAAVCLYPFFNNYSLQIHSSLHPAALADE